MSASSPPKVVEASGANALLADLCRPLVHRPFVPDCEIVQPEEIPYPEDYLLVHRQHMTTVLESHHGTSVDVHVLEEHFDGDHYTRKISLTPKGSSMVVEWGIVRLNRKYMPEAAMADILSKQLPLGSVLIKHNVHRRVKPRYFVRVPAASTVVALFDAINPEPLYGRLGMIYCDNEPCIEVLEIVLNTKK